MNQFQIARDFYKPLTPLILAEKKNAWVVTPCLLNEVLRMTPIESAIWERIRAVNAVFYPQHPVDEFFADFANPVAKIAIECDGVAFHADKAKDAERDRRFQALGWLVYRIPGRLCITEFGDDMEEPFSLKFIRAISERHGLTRGNPKLPIVDEMTSDYMRYALEGKLAHLGIQT